MNRTLSIHGNAFVQDGQPVQLLSGAIHYFRVVPDYWRDRLLKLKAMGLNTVETYVAWNLHEPRPGRFDFAGGLDLPAFVRLAGELDLNVIVRPGPYICAEWDLGGMPAWLLRDATLQLRCACKPFLKAVDRFLDALMPPLAPLMASRGGPIVALQVENEYGSYGNDKTYLRHLADGLRRRGGDVLLFTSDGPGDLMLQGGTLPDIFKVVNFGSRAAEAFAKLREHQPEGPLMCGEFWCGWFDHWGDAAPHHTRAPEEVARELETMLAAKASVNFYMFHGGTNFGFMAGANYTEKGLQPDVTSYDYDAPLNEWGEPTPKFHAAREVIARHFPLPPLELPPPIPRRAFGTLTLDCAAPLIEQAERLAKPVFSPGPLTMEALGQGHGFVLYRTTIKGPLEQQPLTIQACHDRAQVFLDGVPLGVIEREMTPSPVSLTVGSGEHTLDILVENLARINYGPRLHDRKGITEHVRIGHQLHFGWIHFALPFDNLRRLRYTPAGEPTAGPTIYRGTLNIDTPADTFVHLPGWTKGAVWINGFNLGRFWNRGPQQALYLPGPLLHPGRNEIHVLELHSPGPGCHIELKDYPDLGPASA